MRRYFSLVVLSLAAASGGCGEPESVDAILSLVAQPDGTTEAEVLAPLVTLEWLLDADGGFSGLDGSPPDPFQLVDPDGDGQSELLYSMSAQGRQRLPRIGLTAGSNRSQHIAVRVRGVDRSGEGAAYGSLAPQPLFSSGTQNTFEVPFRLRRDFMPPRIVALLPQALPTDGELASVAFLSSSPLDAVSVAGHARVLVVASGGSENQIGGTWRRSRACPFHTEMWSFDPVECNQDQFTVGVRIVLAPEVRDVRGHGVVDSLGNPGFSGTLELDLTRKRGFGPCTPPQPCAAVGLESILLSDLRCDPETGLWEPAACTVRSGACGDPADVFQWVEGATDPSCQAYRDGAFSSQGLCLPGDPWPCQGNVECDFLGTTCDTLTGQCSPRPVTAPARSRPRPASIRWGAWFPSAVARRLASRSRTARGSTSYA